MSRLTDHEWDDYNEPGCQDCSAYAYDCCRVDNAISDCHRRLIYNRLAAYEDAEEQGLLVRLPCKAGERWMRDGKQYIVAEISVTSAWGIMVRHYEEGNGEMLSCNPQYFAKHYTRAEAEAAMKGDSQ